MPRMLTFVTGNRNKLYDASTIAKRFDVLLRQAEVDVHEIQHHDAIEITKVKVESAWQKLREPVVVNDSSYDIPALGGFPGGYMKDVTKWLTTEDFMNLMATKTDKRILLTEVVAYYDGDTMHLFTHEREGFFYDKPRGKSLPTFGRLVEMKGENMTIAEVFDKGNWDTSSRDRYKHWYDFFDWYTEARGGS